ncbi:alpha-N-acetylglucosaminidase-like isoform X2 [Portunus trituberculatus]|uniref:alpha-N-acetylglucosaminidase-like isoform X2 n=1 Tax=Portunus trituberculatus TaxID=210409 RepID=UPI001E1CFF23|nr:alpha-N-acetylglucosaminidase-like isoform X2 [Portunus trituberculatus]
MKPPEWCSFLVLPILLVTASQEEYTDVLPTPDVMKAAVESLLTRLLHHRGRDFTVEIEGLTEGKDYFKVHGEGVEGQPVRVWAGTGVAAALGVMTYLKYLCNASVSWEANQLSNLPDVWPEGTVESQLLDRYRYYSNPCVFSYSYAFWSWERWEKEIDLMALMGINLALALNGEEAIWREVYRDLGLTEKELEEHFAGYAFLAWGRMGNLERWGGPLSIYWQEEKLKLQKRIVARMRELGMLTVLPGFSGHVPKGILRVFPTANITRLHAWGHFSEPYTRTYFLNPQDPLFEKIAEAFIKKITRELGSDHFYLVDPFNEMNPVSSDLTYLEGVSQAIYGALQKGDPEAVWVTQGWMFYSDSGFWQKPQARAYLTAVPQGKMLVLDLVAEVSPQYGRLESYFGQPFIFCLLNNYGGVRGIFGNANVLLKNLADARQFPNSTLVGTGMTPEGIGSNYVIFDLLSEMSWRSHMRDIREWAVQYSRRRYGIQDENLEDAWKLLMSSIYNCSEPVRYHGKYTPLMLRPRLNPKTKMWYYLKDFVRAWDLLIGTAKEQMRRQNNQESRLVNTIMKPTEASLRGRIIGVPCKRNEDQRESEMCKFLKKEYFKSLISTNGEINRGVHLLEEETLKYDLVEVTRELMQLAAVDVIKTLIRSYRKRDITAIEDSSNQLQELISDMNMILGSNSNYLLGSWVQSALNWSNDTQEHTLVRRNSLYQISLWGPNGEILDYAVKQWNGVMERYVAPRWSAFSEALLKAVKSDVAVDMAKFKATVFEAVEKPFAEDLDTFYPSSPIGDSVKLAVRMHEKYRPLFTRRKLMKQYMKLRAEFEEPRMRRG